MVYVIHIASMIACPARYNNTTYYINRLCRFSSVHRILAASKSKQWFVSVQCSANPVLNTLPWLFCEPSCEILGLRLGELEAMLFLATPIMSYGPVQTHHRFPLVIVMFFQSRSQLPAGLSNISNVTVPTWNFIYYVGFS